MTLLDKIDTVFEWLYIHSGENPNLTKIQTGLEGKDIDIGEIKDILAKLKDEKLIYCVLGENRMAIYSDYCNYLISFDGKYFYETVKTFKEKIKRENDKATFIDGMNRNMENNATLLTTWTRRLFYGTVAAAVGGLGLLVIEIVKALHFQS